MTYAYANLAKFNETSGINYYETLMLMMLKICKGNGLKPSKGTYVLFKVRIYCEFCIRHVLQ